METPAATTGSCPADEVLMQLSQGTLDDERLNDIGSHLDGCPSCRNRIQWLMIDDPLLAEMADVQSVYDEQSLHESVSKDLSNLIRRRIQTSLAQEPLGNTVLNAGSETSQPAIEEHPAAMRTDSTNRSQLGHDSNFGNYIILRRLGVGGMGEVYLARQLRLDRLVAIKTLAPALTENEDAYRRFEREIRAVGKLAHPNIVQAFDAGEVGGIHYLAMEYIDGTDLKQAVSEQGTISVTKACDYMGQACQALAAAHQVGLVHRDFKPANLLLSKTGQVKLLDLGLAFLMENATNADLTTAGQTFGTADYMPPEQWEDSHAADARSDLYSLGCTLFFLLVGRAPFNTGPQQSVLQKMRAHDHNEIPRLSDFRPEVPESLDQLFRQLLAKRREDRPQSADDVLESLRQIQREINERSSTAIELTNPTIKLAPESPSPKLLGLDSDSGRSSSNDPPRNGGHSRRGIGTWGWASGLTVLLFGVIIITIRTNGGKNVVRVTVPPNASVAIDIDAEGQEKVADLPADKQVEAVSRKLMELNPGFDGVVTPQIEGGVVTGLKFVTDNVTNISPVQALANLKVLSCAGSGKDLNERGRWAIAKLADISPLTGLSLTSLDIRCTHVSDLLPLKGMKLTSLSSAHTWIFDLSPLKGMPLEFLDVEGIRTTDLLPLTGMPLKELIIGSEKQIGFVTDLSPLKDMPLQRLGLYFRPNRDTELLRSIKTLETINGKPAVDFCDKVEAYKAAARKPRAYQTHGFDQWITKVSAQSPERQLEAVSQKLVELNPGFDGRLSNLWGGTPVIEGGLVTKLGLLTDNVTDISPLRIFVGLQELNCSSSGFGLQGGLSDLSPLSELSLTQLVINFTHVSDLSPLKKMKQLTQLSCGAANISDLSPLRGLPLNYLNLMVNPVSDLSPLTGMPLNEINLAVSPVSDLSPLQGMRLTRAAIRHSRVTDLSPIRKMPLNWLTLDFKPDRDSELLRSITTLETINDKPKSEFWKEVEQNDQVGSDQAKVEPGSKIEPASIEQVKKSTPHEEAGKSLAFQTPEFQEWLRKALALPASERVDVIRKKFLECNPEFSGELKFDGLNGQYIHAVNFWSDDVVDLSPLRACTRLSWLECRGIDPAKNRLTDLSPLQGAGLEGLVMPNTSVRDLTPLKGMRSLQTLHAYGTQIIDLSPLQGLSIVELDIHSTAVSDLSPLIGMPLSDLRIGGTRVVDISPIAGMQLKALQLSGLPIRDLSLVSGMPLEAFHVSETMVSDLSPLRGKRLKELLIAGTLVDDLTPLSGMPLEVLELGTGHLANFARDFSPLRTMPLKSLYLHPAIDHDLELLKSIKTLERINDRPVSEFCAMVEAAQARIARPLAFHDPNFQDWCDQTATLSADAQVSAISTKLRELNPGFDGQLKPVIQDGAVVELQFDSAHVTDISPIHALRRLRRLDCSRISGFNALESIRDLSPLKGLPLNMLMCNFTQVADLAPLTGMELYLLILGGHATRCADLSPLKGMPLKGLSLSNSPVNDLSPLRGMKLSSFFLEWTRVDDLTPIQEMPLMSLLITRIKARDFSPLRGMDLQTLTLTATSRADLEVVRSLPNLILLNGKPPAEALKEFEAVIPKGR